MFLRSFPTYHHICHFNRPLPAQDCLTAFAAKDSTALVDLILADTRVNELFTGIIEAAAGGEHQGLEFTVQCRAAVLAVVRPSAKYIERLRLRLALSHQAKVLCKEFALNLVRNSKPEATSFLVEALVIE